MATVTQHADANADLKYKSGFKHDYVDVFTVHSELKRSPEQWARAIGKAAGSGGQFIWRGVLQLNLRSTQERIGGWKVADQGDDWIRLEARSWALEARLVLDVDEGDLTVCTFIKYRNAFGTNTWPQVAKIHRRLMPRLLNGAVVEVKKASS